MSRDGHMKRKRPQIEASGEPSRTRGCNRPTKRKSYGDKPPGRRPSKLAKQVWKGKDNPRNGHDQSTSRGELLVPVLWRSYSRDDGEKQDDDDDHDGGGDGGREIITHCSGKASPPVIPEKHVLELVLDTLQRRDTYELFAEPVNPDEVEDYYEIIKEPMDFGTMRAKLHEGMYQTLQQFQNDVFLIPENAMHFNSSATTYFRQARAIHELAKKVFHALKMDPENFVLEFSGTRRRSMRKALSEQSKDSRLGINNGFSKGTSTFHNGDKKTSGKCVMESPTTRLGFSSFSGTNRQMLSSQEAVGRFESKALRISTLQNDNTLVGFSPFNSSNRLLLINQGDISYMDSLISFVKDLGPAAQMVARRKLLGAHESIHNSHPNFDRLLRKATGSIVDLTKDKKEANGSRRREPITSTSKKESAISTGNHGSNKIKRGYRDMGKSDDNARPVILALENSQPKGGSEYKIRNKKNNTSPTLPLQNEGKRPSLGTPCTPFASQFAFDLPFLKARLDQMNATKRIGPSTLR